MGAEGAQTQATAQLVLAKASMRVHSVGSERASPSAHQGAVSWRGEAWCASGAARENGGSVQGVRLGAAAPRRRRGLVGERVLCREVHPRSTQQTSRPLVMRKGHTTSAAHCTLGEWLMVRFAADLLGWLTKSQVIETRRGEAGEDGGEVARDQGTMDACCRV